MIADRVQAFLAAVRPRRPRPARRRERRARRAARPRRRRHVDDAEGRRRDVRREGRARRHGGLLLRGDAQHRPARPARRPAACPRRRGRALDALPAEGQPADRRGRAASRRCCAGTTRCTASSCRTTSSRSPSRPDSSSRSRTACSHGRRAGRRVGPRGPRVPVGDEPLRPQPRRADFVDFIADLLDRVSIDPSCSSSRSPRAR